MKSFNLTAFILSAIVFTYGCTSKKSGGSASTVEEASAEKCLYSYVPALTKINWTAYKTTEKVGVGGTFEQFEVNGTKEAEEPFDVFSGATFSIPVASLSTGVPDRDEKIKTFFFGTLQGSDTLSGALKSVSGDSAVVALAMNGMEKDFPATIKMDSMKVTLSSVIDVTSWNAQAGVDALNEKCYDLHKGADGTSKLWPEVKIEISSKLFKECE